MDDRGKPVFTVPFWVIACLLILILPIALRLLYTSLFYGPIPAYKEFKDMDELVETLTNQVKYPSYFPEGFNFLEDNNGQSQVSITGFFLRAGRLKRDQRGFIDYAIESRNDRWNKDADWRLHYVRFARSICDDYYSGSGYPDEIMTLISREEEYDLYFYFIEDYSSHVYTFSFFDKENSLSYSFQFYYYHSNNDIEAYVNEDIYAFSLREAEKMFESLKTYEEMQLFLQTH